VTVLHGLPGFTADVYVNGKLTLDGFKPLASAGPLQLPPGRYDIAIREVGAPAESKPALEGTVELKAGTNVSIVAHPDNQGSPSLSVFVNDLTPVKAGRSRLVVRQVAAAPDLDVSVDGQRRFTGLKLGASETATLAAGRHSILVTEAQQTNGLIGPKRVNLKEGTARILYVTGSAQENTLDLMSQTLAGLQSGASVLSGDGGLAAPHGIPLWAAALMALAAVGVVRSAWSLLLLRGAAGRAAVKTDR
jgi:hypothetical protein